MSKLKESFSYYLFVEGKNDLHVISSLCGCHHVNQNFNIKPCESVENVVGLFRLALTNPLAYQRIGIVLDADVDIEKRWKQLVDVLKGSGKYDCDGLELSPDGLILHPVNDYDAIVGIWIMPDNTLKGMLEDFALNMIPAGDSLFLKSEAILSELESTGIQRYKQVHRSKAKIHTFLAWQDEPGKPIGQAITAHILNPDAEQAKIFVDWLNKLYN
ncbi:DUF3226 domain-containing protein [Bacteroides helcogenes]|uniref:DUF4435 domain-containing protein n=1 Tax=Bacteroides helcogenes (strain ATCC 35417 / DSM 20613 / JCM 6297 / CCUG 15421 / P 36-108) TaxID=693979 RepID=E6SMU3_BACT6|nr:DUF3226 domain-containing protein [Bacteroides helcogenes]ADV42659.1 hypothetical protein Bache_0636 [Bacteroides helcogenes P 36-108]MDY5239491.1 DUF3226 domain-containing protein [Bacteroides helcogenes]